MSYGRSMMQGLTGWYFVIILYVLVLAVIALVLYFTVRLAVLHALKAHTRWVSTQPGPDPLPPA